MTTAVTVPAPRLPEPVAGPGEPSTPGTGEPGHVGGAGETAPGSATRGRGLPVAVWAVMLPGVLLLAFVAFLAVGSNVEAHRAQTVLRSRFADQLQQAVAPVSGTIAAGVSVAELDVPRIGLRQVVVNGSAAEQTSVGPGLEPSSALPGQAGVSLVVGRRATFGAPFRHLDELRRGDVLRVTTGQGVFRYRVDVVRTSDAPASRIRVAASRLTLVTSDPALTPQRRLLVSGTLEGAAQARSTVGWDTASQAPGAGSRDRAVPLLLWAQLLLIVVVLATWAAVRFPRRTVWLGAAPVLAAVLWNVFDALAVLLPNTL